MTEPAPGEPWAYIAHKDGRWGGVCAGNMARRDLSKFLGEFAADGFAIMTVFNRDEYNKALAGLKPWSKE